MSTNIFVMGLAAALPYSLFDATAPQPFEYLSDLANFFFGDEDERNDAFYGDIPWPGNILKPIMPPSARVLTMWFNFLGDDNWRKVLDYQAYSLFPGGLMARAMWKSYQRPETSVRNLTGFPLRNLGWIMADRDEVEAWGPGDYLFNR